MEFRSCESDLNAAAQPEAGEPRCLKHEAQCDHCGKKFSVEVAAPAVEPLTAEQWRKTKGGNVEKEWWDDYRAEAYARQVRQEAERHVAHFSKQNLEWANCAEKYQQENAGLRKRIHHLEQHNQHFYRCESAWCNPGLDMNPALEDLKQLSEIAAKREADIARLTAERDVLKDERRGREQIARASAKESFDRANRAEAALREQLAISGQLQAKLTMAETLIQRFVDKLNVIIPKVGGIIALGALRSGVQVYNGPSIEQEMKDAESLLALKSKAPAEEAQ